MLRVILIIVFWFVIVIQFKAFGNNDILYRIGIGKSWFSYPEELKDNVNEFGKLSKLSKTSICSVLPAVYANIYINKLFAGIQLEAALDRYASEFGGREISMHTFVVHLSPSILYYLYDEFEGPYTYINVGLAYIYYTNSNHVIDFDQMGFACSAGIGYSFPLGKLKLQLSSSYSFSFVGRGIFDVYSIKAGLQF